MKKKNELSYKDLKMSFNTDVFKFKTTDELESISTGIGQDRGIKALEFGLKVDVKGYNLYLEGPSGVGKTMYSKNYLTKIATSKKSPNDWCYVYNFDNPNEPVAICLPAGQGKEFKEAMEGFVKEVKKDIKKTFNADDFEKEKSLIKKEFEAKRATLMESLDKKASKYNFQVKSAQNGIYMMPIVDGKTIEEAEFDKLPEAVKKVYEDNAVIVQEQIMLAIGKIKEIEKEADKKISEWQSNITLLTVNVHINYLKSKFKRNKKITKYLNDIKQDILKNISYFLEGDRRQPTPQQLQMGPIQKRPDPCDNYRVNLFIDNSDVNGFKLFLS